MLPEDSKQNRQTRSPHQGIVCRGKLVKERQLAAELEKQLQLTVTAIAKLGKDLAASNDARHLATAMRHVQEDIDTARVLGEVLEYHILERLGRARR
jgi:hypothetical protein